MPQSFCSAVFKSLSAGVAPGAGARHEVDRHHVAAPILIRIVAVPFATRLVDRRGEVRFALAAAATLSAADMPS
jgi:hypothetical protein